MRLNKCGYMAPMGIEHFFVVPCFRGHPSRDYPCEQVLAYSEEIWIFGAFCLYWCDVELHMYPIVVSGDSILGAKVSGFDVWRFILGGKVSVLISGDFHLERLFIWVSGRV